MNEKQNAIYDFLGELGQSFHDNNEPVLAAVITSSAIEYIKSIYEGPKLIEPEQLARNIAQHFDKHQYEMKAFRDSLDKEFPPINTIDSLG